MVKRKTPEEYYNDCKEKGYDLPIEDYVNGTTKLKFKCDKGHIYLQNPRSHLQGRKCPECAIKNRINNRKGSNAKKTLEDYYNECKEKGYDLPISNYINNSTPILHMCEHCGYEYEQSPSSHLQGRGCPKCGSNSRSKKRTKKSNVYYNECKENGYDLPIEPYKNARTKIKHKCKQGHIYKQTPDSHLRGQGCPICNGSFKKSSKDYRQECKEKGYDLPVDNYINAVTKINHKCPKGHIYKQTPDKHHQGYGCPICKESHGEKFIRNYLDKNNINYISQKTFKDLKDKQSLSYDFYLPSHKILIEYQGIQHYESVSFNGKDNTDLAKQQLHDKLKKEYAKTNHYKLLELHYSLDTQEKVDRYLERRLKK